MFQAPKCINSFNPYNKTKRQVLCDPHFMDEETQVQKLSTLTCSRYLGGKCQGWASNPDRLAPAFDLIITELQYLLISGS